MDERGNLRCIWGKSKRVMSVLERVEYDGRILSFRERERGFWESLRVRSLEGLKVSCGCVWGALCKAKTRPNSCTFAWGMDEACLVKCCMEEEWSLSPWLERRCWVILKWKRIKKCRVAMCQHVVDCGDTYLLLIAIKLIKCLTQA